MVINIHLNSKSTFDVTLQRNDQLGAAIIFLERKLNIKIDESRYGLYTSDNQQMNLNAIMKQIKYNEFWLKPEYDISKENVHKVFGVDLGQLEMHEATKIPWVLHKCFEFLAKERVLRTVGLFRLTGNKTEIERYKRLFESPSAAKEIDFSNSIDPNIVTGIVKAFFKEMPEPLLLYRNFPFIIQIGEIANEIDRMKNLKTMVHNLPESHYNILKYVMEYLIRLIMYNERNRITSANMALVFGPLFIRKDPRSKDLGSEQDPDFSEDNSSKAKRRGLSQRAKIIYINTIGDMIENYSFIFEREENALVQGEKIPDNDHSHRVRNLLLNLTRKNEETENITDPSQESTTVTATATATTSVSEQDNNNGQSGSQATSFAPTLTSIVTHNDPSSANYSGTKMDTSRFFSQLRTVSASNQKLGLKNVGIKKNEQQQQQQYNPSMLLPVVTPRSALAIAQARGGGPSPRAGAPENVEIVLSNGKPIVPSLNLSNTESHKKIIADLEEKLAVEKLTVERLKEEKEDLAKEFMEKRKELNRELDEYLEKQKLLNAEMNRMKSKFELAEQEYKDQIRRLEDEITRLKREKSIKKEDNKQVKKKNEEEEEEMTKRAFVSGSIHVSERFKKLTSNPPQQQESKSTENSSDESADSDREQRTASTQNAKGRKKYVTVVGNNPNLFDDQNTISKSPKKEQTDNSIGICLACKCSIKAGESYVLAKGNNYHSECFLCVGCKCTITGAFAEKQGKFYCKPCLDKIKAGVQIEPSPNTLSEDVCARCRADIPKNEKIRALKKQFHKHCFRCFRCNAEFEDNKFYSQDGDPVCLQCKKASIKK